MGPQSLLRVAEQLTDWMAVWPACMPTYLCAPIQMLAAASGGICPSGYQLPPCPLPMPRPNDAGWDTATGRVAAFRLISSPLWVAALERGDKMALAIKQQQQQQLSGICSVSGNGAFVTIASRGGAASAVAAPSPPGPGPGAPTGADKGRRRRQQQQQPQAGGAAKPPPSREAPPAVKALALLTPSQVQCARHGHCLRPALGSAYLLCVLL